MIKKNNLRWLELFFHKEKICFHYYDRQEIYLILLGLVFYLHGEIPTNKLLMLNFAMLTY